MMTTNDNEYSISTVTNQSKTISSQETTNSSTMSPTVQSSNANGEQQQQQQPVLTEDNDLNQNESQEKLADTEPKPIETNEDDDEFIRITAAHQMLTEAQTFDEKKEYPSALHLYRICVDLLLEELMFTEGTEQSRVYLREKCTAIMDRIDVLKKMLDPIPPPQPPQPITTTSNEQTTNPPTEELNSLHLS